MAKVHVEDFNKGIELVPPGNVHLRVDKCELIQTQNEPFRDMFKLMFAVTEDGPFLGQKIFETFVIDNTPGKEFGRVALRKLLKVLDVFVDEDGSWDTDDAIGKEVIGVVAHVENKQTGEVGARVRRYIPIK